VEKIKHRIMNWTTDHDMGLTFLIESLIHRSESTRLKWLLKKKISIIFHKERG
jgi:hypothetical protein